MTPGQRAQLQAINEQVNAIPYVAETGADEPYDEWLDAPHPGWSFECRDFAIRKAKLLRDAGWPAAGLHNILCYTELGDFHSVCGVDGDVILDQSDPLHQERELLILDNRWPEVYPKTSPPYAYRWAWEQVAGQTTFEAMT